MRWRVPSASPALAKSFATRLRIPRVDADPRGAGAVPTAVSRGLPASHLPGLPTSFYRGPARARLTALVAFVVLIGSLGGLGAAHWLDLGALFGPHVARSEWAFSMSGARELNARGLTGRGVTVCLVDSGVDLLHPDFAKAHVVAWKDFVNARPNPYDDEGHGTAMAGLIAANGALRGIAPDADLIIVKAINANGTGRSRDVADGIRFCVDPRADGGPGADIVSVSLGSKAPLFVESKVYDAVVWATARGVIVVAAAGNDGQFDDGDVGIPADVPLAIAVGAVDSAGHRAPFSSIGSVMNRSDPNLKPEVSAPGVQVVSTAPGAHYVTISGTSPATAIAAGIVALLLQAHPELRPAGSTGNVIALKWALALGARKAPGQVLPHDPWYGYGLVDGLAAMERL